MYISYVHTIYIYIYIPQKTSGRWLVLRSISPIVPDTVRIQWIHPKRSTGVFDKWPNQLVNYP